MRKRPVTCSETRRILMPVLGLLCFITTPLLHAQDTLTTAYPQPDPFLGEHLQINEAESTQLLITTLEAEIRKSYAPGAARRDAHPKAHGCAAATFDVNESLDPQFAHGVFLPGASYQATIRFSNGSPNATGDDITGDTRGMAIKLHDVPGEKLFAAPGHETEHDFILISSPYFFINDAADYVKFFTAVNSHNGWQLIKIPFLLGFKGSWHAYRMLSQKIANPLETRYWSVVPYQLGLGEARQAVKYSVRSCTESNSAIPEKPSSNYLREAMVKTLAAGPACMEFMIQPRAEDMEVEDAISEWDEAQAPFQPVARLTIHQQDFDTSAQNAACENTSFNPWHALPEHKPLGAISRIRRVVYEAISRLRHQMNAVE